MGGALLHCMDSLSDHEILDVGRQPVLGVLLVKGWGTAVSGEVFP